MSHHVGFLLWPKGGRTVAMALCSCLGGNIKKFDVQLLSDKRFRFSVASNHVGHFIHSLKGFSVLDFRGRPLVDSPVSDGDPIWSSARTRLHGTPKYLRDILSVISNGVHGHQRSAIAACSSSQSFKVKDSINGATEYWLNSLSGSQAAVTTTPVHSLDCRDSVSASPSHVVLRNSVSKVRGQLIQASIDMCVPANVTAPPSVKIGQFEFHQSATFNALEPPPFQPRKFFSG